MSDTTDRCPRCGSGDTIISNIDGYECDNCGCWFDRGELGELIYAYDGIAMQLDSSDLPFK